MTFDQVRHAAGDPTEVIARPELLRTNSGHSPFAEVWVYTSGSPARHAYVYFGRAGRVASVMEMGTGHVPSLGSPLQGQ
jgi:hypothetical protein